MSALAWLFGFGALAVAFPLLFHLIRRTPKGQTEFSSLMFLKPTPPTLTRRSRLDNLLLLLMRAAAICLIAFAFMRPFFRGSDTLSEVEIANRRVAILIDTSASMQRKGLWDQARKQVESVLDDLEPGDDVALLAFDNQVRTVVDFDNSMDVGTVDRPQLIREGLSTIEPGWLRSDLGKALVSVADSLDIWRDSQQAKDSAAPAKLQIVVVSDLQKGSKIESLQSYQWPPHVFVKFDSVIPTDFSNATVQLLDSAAESDDPSIRVRVANSDESKLDQFFVNWSGSDLRETDQPVSFYVPAGTSHVLKVEPDQAIGAQQFTVTGDQEEFDNTFFVVPTQQQVLNISYIGNDDPDDPEQPQYYLRRAMLETPARSMRMRQMGADEKILDGGPRPTLLVLTAPVSEFQREEIDAYLKSGGTLAIVLADPETVESTINWTASRSKEDVTRQKQSRDNYQMLAEIDFSSQLFQPFANSRYNDFTKIRFWNHQSVELIDDSASVLARFENDDPAVWKLQPESGGQVYVLASGWQPSQSQLALSSKFVPLVNGLIEIAADIPQLSRSVLVGDRIDFPASDEFTKRAMIKPDGSREIIEPAQTAFDGADQPGIYRLRISGTNVIPATESSEDLSQNEGLASAADPEVDPSVAAPLDQAATMMFAVNVDRAESETVAIPIEQIEMFEVNVGQQETAASQLAQMREMRDRDIESRQKVWKWLIVAALLLLIGETLLAGQTGYRMLASETESAIAPGRLSGETT